MAGCHDYAQRLASYITDASTVRVRTLEHFGRAPSVSTIRKMMEKCANKKAPDAALYVPETKGWCGHPRNAENVTIMFNGAMRCNTCRHTS